MINLWDVFSVWKWGRVGVGLDPAFSLLFHENPASRSFFIAFSNSFFVSKHNEIKQLKE